MSDASIELLPETVPIGIIAALFGVSERQARNLLEAANVKPASRGRWHFAGSVRAIYDKARENRESSELTKARAQAVRASARKTELATAREERELVSREETEEVVDFIVGTVNEELNGLAARLTCDRDLRARYDAEIMAAKGRVATALATASGALKDGDPLPFNYAD